MGTNWRKWAHTSVLNRTSNCIKKITDTVNAEENVPTLTQESPFPMQGGTRLE